MTEQTTPKRDDQPELSVLLVNWNTREMTLECLRSVKEQTSRTDYEIIVVDNGSTDGSVEAIRQEFPDVRLIVSETNLGFGAATNLQGKQAYGKKLLLLNTDTVVLDQAIDRLMDFSRRQPEAKIWGGRTLYADKSLNPTSCWGRLTPWRCTALALGLTATFPNSTLCNSISYPGWDRDDERHVDIVTGCLLMIEREFWADLKGFDSRFFMFGEEADLCLRAHKAGARPMITPDATVIHYDGSSNRNPDVKRIYMLNSTMGLINAHMDGVGRWVARRATIANVALRAMIFSVASAIRPSRYRSQKDHWRTVWNRRDQWRHGPIETELLQ